MAHQKAWFLSLRELAHSLRQGELSCQEVTQAFLQRIHEVNPKLNAVVQLHEQEALTTARRLDQKPSSKRGALHGIPFTLKDMISAKGCRVSAGTFGLRNHVTPVDASLTMRLKRAGAILLGHTNMAELGMAADTDNLLYGRTANPYCLDCSPGGSSGGAAAIVAAGGAMFDIGSDTGGSVRIPAHYCGVAAIRPTIGRIPNTGIVPGPRSGIMGLIGTFGPIARFVDDLSILLNLISGADNQDPLALPRRAITPAKVKCSRLRIAYFLHNGVTAPDPEVAQTVRESADALRAQGMDVHEDTPPDLAEGYALFWALLGAPGPASYYAALKSLGTEEASPLFRRCMEILADQACTTEEFMSRWRRWTLHRSQILQFMRRYDAMLCPVTARAALPNPLTMWDPEVLPGFSYSAGLSMSGLPAATVRAGTSSQNLPIGVQILAKPWREDIALALARCIEQALGGFRAPQI